MKPASKSPHLSTAVFLFIFLGFPALFTNPSHSNGLPTRAQAVSILIEQVIDPSPNKDVLITFGPQDMLFQGDVVEPFLLNTPPYTGSTKTIDTPTWFFWINDQPKAKFVHECQFVYIDATHANPVIGDGIIVETQGWWPKINGLEYYNPMPYVHPYVVYGSWPVP